MAGKLLRKHMDEVGLDSESAVYMNAVSCYPHGTPSPGHVKACKVNLRAQLEAIPTEYVLVCGAVAMNALMPRVSFGRAIGRAIPVHGKIVFPIYHPAYILRMRQEVLMPWREELARFKQLQSVGFTWWNEFMNRPDITCLYCKAQSDMPFGYGLVCRQHTAKWRKDLMWPLERPVQETMFDD